MICPKYSAVSGTVNSMAPAEADTPVSTARAPFHRTRPTRWSFPGLRDFSTFRYIQSYSGEEASNIPATDAKESCSPTLAAAKGFWISSRSRAKARAVGPSPSRRARASPSSPAPPEMRCGSRTPPPRASGPHG